MKIIVHRPDIGVEDLLLTDQGHVVTIVDGPSTEHPRDPAVVEEVMVRGDWTRPQFDNHNNCVIAKIAFIKMVRALTGWGLKEAKDWVEAKTIEYPRN
jgi:hypothetical protein